MYNDFYGFTESPFNITPDPRFLFFSHRHREAYNHILFGIKERKGFIQLTGEVGAGKTTICRAILEALTDSFETGLVLNPMVGRHELLLVILSEFGLIEPGTFKDRVSALNLLNNFLLDQVYRGRDVVLFIDEAQDLNPDLLEEVRLLSNLETDQRKLLQIVLIGQPELRTILDRKELRQLRQRITVRYHLSPLTMDETTQYIQHRLHYAGGNSRPMFNRWAIRAIHRYSKGIPRLINAVSDKTLLCGYAESEDHLRYRHVRRAIRELEGHVR